MSPTTAPLSVSPTSPPGPRPPTPGARAADPVAAGRVPPQDLEAEMCLLGSMMVDRDCIGLIVQIIGRDEATRFYRPDHRVIFETLVDLYDNGRPMELLPVEEELRRRGQLEEVGGRGYLLDLCNSVASAASAEYYARVVRDKSMLRDLIRSADEIIQTAYAQQEAATHILDDAEKRIFAATEQRISHQAVSIRELLAETFKQIENFEEGAITGVPTGFTELDALLGGMQNGDFIIIAARPSMGKTSLGLSMLESIGITEGLPSAFFSMEMGKLQIAQRMLCARAHVSMSKLRHGRLSGPEIAQLQLACGHMQGCPVFIDDTPGMSVMEVRAKTRRLRLLHGIRVVFVDYLQLMSDRTAARENRQQEISSISRGLKALARELNIPVVALAQLNRQVEVRSSNRPRMSDLRESGAIEQDADVIVLLHREDYYWDKKKRHEQSEQFQQIQGRTELIVDKQRNGPTGVVEVHFNELFARFDNAASKFVHEDEGYAADSYVPGDFGDAGGLPQTSPSFPEDDEAAPF